VFAAGPAGGSIGTIGRRNFKRRFISDRKSIPTMAFAALSDLGDAEYRP